MTDREKLIDIINTAFEGYAENLMQPYGAEVLADYLIANGARISPWISAKDKLPKKGDVVLAVWHGDVEIVMYAPHRLGWSNFATGYDSPNAVTHWMPLPVPPKEE